MVAGPQSLQRTFTLWWEGAAAQETRVSGTFNLEGYRDILLFAQRLNTLSVEADGNGWVIRSRKVTTQSCAAPRRGFFIRSAPQQASRR